MTKFAETLIPILMLILGCLLVLGEWLCVGLAWHCAGYGSAVISVGLTLVISGFIILLAVLEQYKGDNDA